jgi:hypothetical protein
MLPLLCCVVLCHCLVRQLFATYYVIDVLLPSTQFTVVAAVCDVASACVSINLVGSTCSLAMNAKWFVIVASCAACSLVLMCKFDLI